MSEARQRTNHEGESGKIIDESDSILYMGMRPALPVSYYFKCTRFPSTGLGFKLKTDFVTLRSVERSDDGLWTLIQIQSQLDETFRELFDHDLDYWLDLRQQNKPLQPLIVENENNELISVMHVVDTNLHIMPVIMNSDNMKHHLLSAHLMYAIILPNIIIHDAVDEGDDRLIKLDNPLDTVQFVKEGGFAGRLKSHIDIVNGLTYESWDEIVDRYGTVNAFGMTATELAQLNFNATGNSFAETYLAMQNTNQATPVVENSVFRQDNAEQANSNAVNAPR